jgi:hypothetical protein
MCLQTFIKKKNRTRKMSWDIAIADAKVAFPAEHGAI